VSLAIEYDKSSAGGSLVDRCYVFFRQVFKTFSRRRKKEEGRRKKEALRFRKRVKRRKKKEADINSKLLIDIYFKFS